MSDILEKICGDKRLHIIEHMKRRPLSVLEKEIAAAPPVRGFQRALEDKVNRGGIGLIAEIKKGSPSAGVMRPDFSPKALAEAYAKAGASCLSILTDEPHFQGHNDYLIEGRASCALPVLRKDFMLDTWQIAESRAIGADCILLIMAALGDAQAAELHAATIYYDMDVLIEVHNEDELYRALKLPSGMIGINNRNLKTLEVDLRISEELIPSIPNGRLGVSESGITKPADIEVLRAWGIHCFLIGESLMKQPDVEAATRKLIAG